MKKNFINFRSIKTKIIILAGFLSLSEAVGGSQFQKQQHHPMINQKNNTGENISSFMNHGSATGIIVSELSTTKQSQDFAYLLMVREGGGDKRFFVSIDSNMHTLKFKVVHFDFRDTTLTFSVSDTGKFAGLYGFVARIIGKKVPIKGDFQESKLPTGTWAHYFIVDKNETKSEITSVPVRDTLKNLEDIVEEHFRE